MEELETGKIKIVDVHYDTLYDVVMEATGSERLANSYRVAAIKAQNWRKR